MDADGNIVDVTTGGDTVSYGGGSVMTEGSVLGNQGQIIAGQSDTDSLITSRFDNFQPTTVVQQNVDTSNLAKSAAMDAGFNSMSAGLGNLDGQGNLTRAGTLTSPIGSVNHNLGGADGTGGIMGGVNQIGTDMTNLGAAEGDVSQLGNRFNTVDTTLANMGSNELDTTQMQIDEIKKIENNDINDLKILLANETTSMLHGKDAAKNSEQAAKEAFSGNSLGSNLPSIKINSKNINNKLDIIDLVILSKLEKSKSEIRRLIKGNAVKINDKIVSDEKLIITNEFFNENYLKLSIGKKRHLKIELD
mgnify:CR=1 FL=1